MGRRHLAVSAALATSLLACGHFLGLTGDDDAPDPPAVTPDAGDGPVSASGEAGPAEAGACGDPSAVFCTGFDDRSLGAIPADQGGYTEMDNTIAIVGEGRSMPNAVAAFGINSGHAIHFFPVVDPSPSHVEVEVWTKLVSAVAPVVFIQVIWSLPSELRHGVKAQFFAGTSQLEEFDGPRGVGYLGPTDGVAQNLSGTWHQVVVDVDWIAKVAKLRFDGVDVVTLALKRDFEGGSGHLDIGALGFGDGNAAERRVLFDDVVVRKR